MQQQHIWPLVEECYLKLILSKALGRTLTQERHWPMPPRVLLPAVVLAPGSLVRSSCDQPNHQIMAACVHRWWRVPPAIAVLAPGCTRIDSPARAKTQNLSFLESNDTNCLQIAWKYPGIYKIKKVRFPNCEQNEKWQISKPFLSRLLCLNKSAKSWQNTKCWSTT